MLSQVHEVRKFFYSHFFLAGLRQAIGMFIPAVLLGLLFQRFDIGIIATFGAACTAIIDQPGGSARRSRRNEMLWGSILACLTYTLTGLAAPYTSVLFILVISLTFLFSMFSVFGKRGALISAACSFLMILSMHTPLPPLTVLIQGGITLLGGLFYLAYSDVLSKVFWYREERQTLADSLFATAQYVQARADLYNVNIPLDDCYRNLIRLQSAMIDKHQATRNQVIRNMPKNQQALENPLRIRIWNTFINMVDLLDILVATHSDYVVIRQKLAGSDIMLFMHDTLAKLSMELERSALAFARGRTIEPRYSVKAELRAIDYELQQYKANHLDEQDGETYTLLLQLSRRLKNTHQCVQDIFTNINAGPNTAPITAVRRPRYLSQFLSRNETRLGLLTSNLTLKSPTFRYAIRVSIAAFCAMSLAYFILPEAFISHAYWILMTCLLIMKPGYAITKQRNRWRLIGTLMGCFITVALIKLNFSLGVYFGIMFFCMVLANGLLLLHYTASTMFISIFVLLAFHFLREGQMLLIGERAIDTLIGSVIAYACSYILPVWERQVLPGLAKTSAQATKNYLDSCLAYLKRVHQTYPSPEAKQAAIEEGRVNVRLNRNALHIAFSNYAEAFYRMMIEPRSQQQFLPEFNHLMVQNHILASQIAACTTTLSGLDNIPPNVTLCLQKTLFLLDGNTEALKDFPTPDYIERPMSQAIKQMLDSAEALRATLDLVSTEAPSAFNESTV